MKSEDGKEKAQPLVILPKCKAYGADDGAPIWWCRKNRGQWCKNKNGEWCQWRKV